MKRIAIFGGTFNPVHFGHLVAAQAVKDRLRLDRVIFVPAFLPPHKKETVLASATDRLNMVKLAIGDNPHFTCSDVEFKRKGKSYSIDTAIFFRKKFPKSTALYFIIGADELVQLHTWKDIDQLLHLVTFVAVNRPGFIPPAKIKDLKHIKVEMPAVDISSSLIRNFVAKGRDIRYLTHPKVVEYIKKRSLYKQR